MFIIVKSWKNFKFVDSLIRLEDIEEIYEDPTDDSKSTIEFYMEKEPLSVNEEFSSLSSRCIEKEEDSEEDLIL